MIVFSLASLIFEQVFPHDVWVYGEAFVTISFTIEYVTMVAVVENRIVYLFCDLSTIADFLAIMPWFIELILGYMGESTDASWILILRLLRIARVSRIRTWGNPYVDLIGKTFKDLPRLLGGILTWMLFASLIMGTFIHVAEPQTFYNIPLAMWYSLVTITTVGYGDVSPTTEAGYMIGSMAILFGLCLSAIVLMSVGSMYNDHAEKLMDNSMEIKQCLLDAELLYISNGDDLHVMPGTTFDMMVHECIQDPNVMINGYEKFKTVVLASQQLENFAKADEMDIV